MRHAVVIRMLCLETCCKQVLVDSDPINSDAGNPRVAQSSGVRPEALGKASQTAVQHSSAPVRLGSHVLILTL